VILESKAKKVTEFKKIVAFEIVLFSFGLQNLSRHLANKEVTG